MRKTCTILSQKFHTLYLLPHDATIKHWGSTGWRFGPTHVFYTGLPMDLISKAWVDTFSAIGYGVIADPFSGRSLGGYAITSTVDSATKIRRYTNPAYLVPASGRSNLHVFTKQRHRRLVSLPRMGSKLPNM
jgi:hypothetical protein